MNRFDPRCRSVTSPGWSVSCTQPYGVPTTLNVQHHRPNDPHFHRPWYGDGNGRKFPNSDAAFAFALERGYTMPYLEYKAALRKVHRKQIQAIMEDARKQLLHAVETKGMVVALADDVKAQIQELPGLSASDALRYGLGVYAMARHLRPDIWGVRR